MSCSRTQHGGGRYRTPDLSLRIPTLYHWATALPDEIKWPHCRKQVALSALCIMEFSRFSLNMADKKIKVHRQVMILPIIQRVKNDSLPKAGFNGIISNDLFELRCCKTYITLMAQISWHILTFWSASSVFAVRLTFWSLSTNSVSSKDS